MTATLGHSCVLLALALALWGIAAPILHARTGSERFQVSARYAILGQFVLVTAAAGALIYALVATDFSIRYVAFNTTRNTPVYYRVTGLWGALEGSLLLWEWILIIFSALVAWSYRRRMREFMPWVLMVFSIVSAFFLAVIAFASNPFEVHFPVPADGPGAQPAPGRRQHVEPSAAPVHGVRGAHRALRLRHGGAHPRKARPRLDRRHPALDHHRVVLPHPRQPGGSLVVLPRARLGRLLGLGPGGERRLHALASGHRVPALGAGAGAARHAQDLEPAADHHRLQPHHLRHLSHALGGALLDPRLFIRSGGDVLPGIPRLRAGLVPRTPGVAQRPASRAARARLRGQPRIGLRAEQRSLRVRAVHHFPRHGLSAAVAGRGRGSR